VTTISMELHGVERERSWINGIVLTKKRTSRYNKQRMHIQTAFVCHSAFRPRVHGDVDAIVER
jgi:hypothetical protein